MQPDTVYKRGGASGFPQYETPPFVEPPARRTPLFPPRFGISVPVPGILEVLGTNRLYPDARGRVSGYAEPGYSGTARPATSWM